MDVLCIGELAADTVVRPVKPIDFSVDSVPVEIVSLKNGGDALNNAINLAKLGIKSGFCGLIGEDAYGRFLYDAASRAGVDVRGLKVSTTPTCSVVVLIKEDGQRSFLHFRGANAELCFEDIDSQLIDECRFVHIGGTFHMARFDGPDAARVLEMAKRKGKVTSMDVAWDSTGRWLNLIRPCLRYLDYFIPSYNESMAMTGLTDLDEIADFFQNEGVTNVVIKLGELGSYVRTPERSFRCNVYSVPVIDTTGAGDAFVSGFLTGLARGWALEQSVEFGTATAAFCIQAVGATTGTPQFEDVVAFVNQNSGNLHFDYT